MAKESFLGGKTDTSLKDTSASKESSFLRAHLSIGKDSPIYRICRAWQNPFFRFFMLIGYWVREMFRKIKLKIKR